MSSLIIIRYRFSLVIKFHEFESVSHPCSSFPVNVFLFSEPMILFCVQDEMTHMYHRPKARTVKCQS